MEAGNLRTPHEFVVAWRFPDHDADTGALDFVVDPSDETCRLPALVADVRAANAVKLLQISFDGSVFHFCSPLPLRFTCMSSFE